ncbi:MAG TPA: hypothetical protein VLM79_16600 [Kofleriaceae bacterium]|nr:hypothetical protein [Kofleriaceae bacterium]
MSNDLIFHPRPRVLLICGNRNHTTTMHAIANELSDCDRTFTPYYCDDWSTLDVLRRAHLLEFVALGHDFRRKCLAYLESHGLATDLGGVRGGYDLVVTCSDLIVPSNIAGIPLVGVQEGMIDPKLFWWRVMEHVPWLPLPRWAAGTACTGLSHAYDRYCVASEGYRRDFVERGAHAERMVVTGLPNFDNFAGYLRPGHWIEGCVLACTSDGRETFRRDDRKRFIRWALEIAGDRPLVFKFHPNERMARAVDEVREWAPHARALTSGSGEELAANCHTLVTEWSTLAYVGLALAKPTYSYRDLEAHRAMLPVQHGRAAKNIAAVCRDVLALRRTAEALKGAA